jgi:hypothetical protein
MEMATRNEDHGAGVNACDDQAPDFEKEEREKQNRFKAKVINIGPFCFR